MNTRHPYRARSRVFGAIAAISVAATTLCAVQAAYADGDGGCAYASSQTPGAPDGAFLTIQWGGKWGESCTPFNPQFTISRDRIDLVFQAGAAPPVFGCNQAETPFCITTTSPMVIASGQYEIHITVNHASSGNPLLAEFMETIVIEPGCAPAWTPAFGDSAGFDGPIDVIVELTTGPGLDTHLYAAGQFTTAGTPGTSHIARWTGDAWTNVGGGLDGAVTALAAFDDGFTIFGQSAPWLFAAGDFAGGVRRWTPFGWSPIGGGLGGGLAGGEVRALAVFDDGLGAGPALYAGGTFTSAGGAPVNGLAKWDGTSWTDVGGGVDGTVSSMVVFDDGSGPALYVGGSFASAGSIPVKSLGKWDGTNWTTVGSQLPGDFPLVTRLFAVDDADGPALYVAGFLGGFGPYDLMRWLGTNFSSQSPGFLVSALAVFDDGSGPALYAGGRTLTFGAPTSGRISRHEGAGSWTALHTWPGRVDAFHYFDDTHGDGPQLFVGAAVSDLSHRVLRLAGDSWAPTNAGIDGVVTGVESFDDGQGDGPAVYIAGGSSTAPELVDNTVSKWDGTQWVPVAGGLSGVRALKVFDDGTGAGTSLFAGSYRFDGLEWSVTGLGGRTLVLESYDDGSGTPVLYAGGSITVNHSGVTTYGIAQWNGSTWTHCGDGVDHNPSPGSPIPEYVRAMAVFDDGQGEGAQLYVGGPFALDPHWRVFGIARWNGTSWSGVGQGPVGGAVTALAVFDDGQGGGPALYAAATYFSGTTTIMRWDGVEWAEVAIADETIDVLRVFDDGTGPQLHAGGTFSAIGGIQANGVARWDGSAWSTLGDGVTGDVVGVRAMTEFDDGSGPQLIMVGGFANSPTGEAYVARWRGCIDDQSVFGDLNGDDIVDGADLGILLNGWGGDGVGDLNGDGIVDGADLGLLLNNWG